MQTLKVDGRSNQKLMPFRDFKMFPPPAPVTPPPPPAKAQTTQDIVVDHKAPYIAGAKQSGYAAAALLGMGAIAPDAAFSSMLTTFALSNVIGVQVVMGVTHALHSPLMAVTNAISGTTALGGMHLYAHSTGPVVTALAAIATTLSTVNIVGECYLRDIRELLFEN